MTVTIASFRTAMPAFANTAKYSDAMVTTWIAIASQLVNADRWAGLTDTGIMFYAAHNMILEAQAAADGAKGLSPGGRVGILTSKGADGISAGYDVSTASEKDAGAWNLTVYGTRYYRLSKMMGAGPLQVGVDSGAAQAGAWPGPSTIFPWV